MWTQLDAEEQSAHSKMWGSLIGEEIVQRWRAHIERQLSAYYPPWAWRPLVPSRP